MPSVSNGMGQCNFSGQRDRSSFIVPRQRDNGTSSKSCQGTGQPVKIRDGTWDGTACPFPGDKTGQSTKRGSKTGKGCSKTEKDVLKQERMF